MTAISTDAAPTLVRPLYAGFWRRVAAFLIDHAIILVPLTALLYGFGAFEILTSDDPLAVETTYLDWLGKFSIGLLPVYLGVLWLYYALAESGRRQATIGKRVLRIKVVDLDGRRLGFWRALGRQIGKLVSKATLGIGFAVAAFTPRKQALHDLFARTLVIREH